MEKSKIIIVSLLLIGILTISFNLYVLNNQPIYSQKIAVHFQVDEKLGIKINETILEFGRVTREVSSTKTINLSNQYDYPLTVKVSVSKEIENYIFGKTNFIIPPKETIEYQVILIIPKETEYRNYQGRIEINFYKK